MSPTLLAGVVDVAMDEGFWAAQPRLQKCAGDIGDAYDDGYISIGGAKIPKKALYGLALGGLAGGAGGIAGKLSPQNIALLVALGAAAGGIAGTGLHGLDSVTESDTPGVSRTEATRRAAVAKATAAKEIENSGGLATIGRGLAGVPTSTGVELGGTAAQVGTGAALGNTVQRMLRAHRLADLLKSRRGIDTQTVPGGEDLAKNSTKIRRLLGATDLAEGDIENVAKAHGNADVERVNAANAPPSTTLTGRLKQLLGKADRKAFGTVAPMPWDIAKQPMPSVDLADMMSRNFSGVSMPTFKEDAKLHTKLNPLAFVGRNKLGTLGGAALGLLPSIGALTSSSPTQASGVLPAASLINRLRGRWQ